jgi:succinate dehydrogenase hydrophobic anchor subunit
MYKRLNLETVIQRVSAVIMVVLFPFHINTYDFLKINSHGAAFWFAETVYIVFYSALFSHIAVSFSKALISLGKLEDDSKRRSINKAAALICALAALITIIITIRTHIKMFG